MDKDSADVRVEWLRITIARAIADPGATEGYKNDRSLTEWQTDAVMRVLASSDLLATPSPAPAVAEGAPTIGDAWIAERWPDSDPAEIRRRFDALMEKLGETPWRWFPRFPEAMQPVLAWAAMLPSERIEVLAAALADVPEYLRGCMWVASRPAFGEQSVKYQNVTGDDGYGMGLQAVAVTPYIKGYNLAPWIAAASPGNVGALLAELERLRRAAIRANGGEG